MGSWTATSTGTRWRLLGELWRAGKTVLCVTHDVNLLRQVGTHPEHGEVRVVGLKEGALAFEQNLSEPQLAAQLSSLFDIHVLTLSTQGGPYFGISPQEVE